MKKGVILLLLGVLALILGGIKFKSREEVFRVGDFHATATQEHTFPALRYAGVALIVAGTVLIVIELGGSRRR